MSAKRTWINPPIGWTQCLAPTRVSIGRQTGPLRHKAVKTMSQTFRKERSNPTGKHKMIL